MKKIFLPVFILLALYVVGIAQEENRANIWYYGGNGGIDFNTNPPTTLSDGAMSDIVEGTSAICDTLGNLLIYTNGEKIWNKNHQVIDGADNLGGHHSATQSSIILPDSYQPNRLYVFSLNINELDLPGEETGHLYYSIIDMSLNNGLGGVVSTRNLLATNCTEKQTVIKHCNKKDFWLIAHELGNTNFLIWRIGELGVESAPTKIAIGNLHQASPGHGTGSLKGSPLGDKMAISSFGGNFVELFDFNTETGEISRPILFNDELYQRPYDLSFSPSGRRLYTSNFTDSLLLQANLNLQNGASIKNSTQVISKLKGDPLGMQIGPDGKIYLRLKLQSDLAVINQPNRLGIGCQLEEEGFKLADSAGGTKFPNFPAIFFRERDTIEVIEMAEDCEGVRTLNAVTNIGGDSVVYQWYFEKELIPDESFTKIEIASNGLYEFKALVYNNCKTVLKELVETVDVQFEEIRPLAIAELMPTVASCNEENAMISFEVIGGEGDYSYSLGNDIFQDSAVFQNLGEGIYTITVKDERECLTSEEVNIEAYTVPTITNISIQPTLCGFETGQFSMQVAGGFGKIEGIFDGEMLGENLEKINIGGGIYPFSIFDETGCTVDTMLVINQLNCPFYLPNAFSPNGDGINDWFGLQPHPEFRGTFLQFNVFDRWGTLIFETKDFDNPTQLWNGTFRDKQLPTGTHIYYLTFENFQGIKEVISGEISLVN